MTKTTVTIMGALLILFALLGFAFPTLFGLQLAPINNLLLIVTGLLAVASGTIGSALAARTFCTYFGFIFGILGLAGPLGVGPDRLLTLIPHHLVFGTMDHFLHLMIGGALLLASLYGKYEEIVDQNGGSRFHEVARHLLFLDVHGHSGSRPL